MVWFSYFNMTKWHFKLICGKTCVFGLIWKQSKKHMLKLIFVNCELTMQTWIHLVKKWLQPRFTSPGTVKPCPVASRAWALTREESPEEGNLAGPRWRVQHEGKMQAFGIDKNEPIHWGRKKTEWRRKPVDFKEIIYQVKDHDQEEIYPV